MGHYGVVEFPPSDECIESPRLELHAALLYHRLVALDELAAVTEDAERARAMPGVVDIDAPGRAQNTCRHRPAVVDAHVKHRLAPIIEAEHD